MGCCDKSPDPEYDEPIQKRGCTDVPCCLIFIIFLGGMGYVGYLGFLYGDPNRVLYGTDSWGNACNKKNAPIENVSYSGADTTGLNLYRQEEQNMNIWIWSLIWILYSTLPVDAAINNYTYGQPGKFQIIKSENGDEPYDKLQNSTYTFTNTKRGSVKVFFFHMDLHPSSVIRIHEGNSAMGKGSIWMHNSSNPVYVTSKSSLYVVFKAGNWNGPNEHYGFRLIVNYTEYGSAEDIAPVNERPVTGFCGDLQASYNPEDGSAVTKYNTDNTSLPVYCSWQKKRNTPTQLVLLPPSDDWFDYIEDNARVMVYDHHIPGKGDLVEPYILNDDTNGIKYIVYEVESLNGFHMMLNWVTFPSKGSKFVFGYSSILSLSKSLVKTAEDPKDPLKECPYKRCPDGRCLNYWIPCDGIASTCDYQYQFPDLHKHCNNTRDCYHTILDTCDNFVDCLNDSEPPMDEHACYAETTSLWWVGIIVIIIVHFTLVIFWIVRRPCKKKDKVEDTQDSTVSTIAGTGSTWAPYDQHQINRSTCVGDQPEYYEISPNRDHVADVDMNGLGKPPSYEEAIRDNTYNVTV